MNEISCNIKFSDLTLIEAEGEYVGVAKLIESEFPYSKKWTIRTNVTMESFLGHNCIGVSDMELQLNSDKKVYILRFNTNNGDLFTNPDIEGLSAWTQKSGWDIPCPDPILVREDIEFWKHFWETLLIDSEYLDSVFGKRPHA